MPRDQRSGVRGRSYAPPVVWKARKRREEIARREADGEVLWSESIRSQARARLWIAVEDHIPNDHLYLGEMERRQVRAGRTIADQYFRELGEVIPPGGRNDWEHIGHHFVDGEVDDALSILELVAQCDVGTDAPLFEITVNSVFVDERIAFEMVNGEFIGRESEELHDEVVVPVLRLLNGRPGWENVETAYQKALREDDPSDAITDTGTALQDALRACGARGGSHGELIKDALKRDLLTGYDRRMLDAIKLLVDWSAADRSTKGDGHSSSNEPTVEDAWLAIHVVGALIFRLAEGTPRDET